MTFASLLTAITPAISLPTLTLRERQFRLTTVSLLTVGLMLFVAYLMVQNSTATQGYSLGDIKETQRVLREQQQDLAIAIAEQQTLFALKSSTVAQQMVEATKKQYISISSAGTVTPIDETIQAKLLTNNELLPPETDTHTVASPQ